MSIIENRMEASMDHEAEAALSSASPQYQKISWSITWRENARFRGNCLSFRV